jgi:DNA-binding CsgD family transcriptional regulator
MKDLTTRDLDVLLSAVERLNDESSARDMPARVLASVEHVIPNDLIAIDCFAEGEVDHLPVHWNNNGEMLTPAIEEVCAAVFEQSPDDNPLIEELVLNGNSGVMKLTDFGDQAGFRETAYYNEIMRPVGFERQMGVMVPVGVDASFSCAVNRKGADFSERERQMLSLLAPHLKYAIELERQRCLFEEEKRRLSDALEMTRSGAVTFSADGHVVQATDLARLYLKNYFPGADEAFPKLLAGRAAGAEINGSPGVNFADATLLVTASTDAASMETTVILTEKPRISPKMLESLGITPRQAEVLYWITEGKTDEVIADLTGAARRTVQKHVENILTRLGAETRTAAARIATALLDQQGML